MSSLDKVNSIGNGTPGMKRTKAVAGIGGGRVNGERESPRAVISPGDGGDVGMGDGLALIGDMQAAREALVAERQEELQNVFERHDTLIREMFHMDTFVTLVGFDPKEAKKDETSVFRAYKSRYDLLESTPQTAGPSRSTRRAHSERMHYLKTPSSITGPPTSPSKFHKDKQRKGKVSASQPSTDAIWDILATAKNKGRGKEKAATSTSMDRALVPEVASSSAWKGKGRAALNEGINDLDTISSASVSHRRTSTIEPPLYNHDDPSTHETGSISAPCLSLPSHRKSRKRTVRDTASVSAAAGSHVDSKFPRKRRKTEPFSEESLVNADILNGRKTPGELTSSTTNTTPFMQFVGAEQSAHRPASHSTTQFATSQTPLKLTSNIKRIKLLVRRPPPPVSNPKQRPPPAKYGSSLQRFMSSFTTIDNQDLDEAVLEEMARKEASLREVAERFRREGRLIPDAPFNSSANEVNTATLKRPPDPWDHVVGAIVAHRQYRRVSGRQIAAQIANKIQAYWEGHATKQDKARAQEERKLRALAKATIKLVTNEWKKAVFHIREQERLVIEAEELKRGHEHLDAILNQSGHILETQQVDLTKGDTLRSRSRSSSVSATFHNWEDDEGEEGDEDTHSVAGSADGTEQEDEYESIHQQLETDEEDADDATNALLMGDPMTEVSEDMTPERALPLSSRTESQEALENAPIDFIPPDSDSIIVPSGIIYTPPRLVSSGPSPQASIESDDEDDEPSIAYLLAYDPQPDSENPSEHSSPQTPALIVDFNDSPDTQASLVSPEPIVSNFNPGLDATPLLEDHGSISRHPIPTVKGFNAPLLDSTIHLESSASQESVADPDIIDENDSSAVFANHTLSEDIPPDAADPEPIKADDHQDGQEDRSEDGEVFEEDSIPDYLKPYAVAPVQWDPDNKVKPPLLLRGILRPYQQSGLEWLASLHTNNLNGILADEMGLGKTIQTISLLAHLACDRGIWGPHLIIVPTSVLLNWEMEFKKFLPGFRILSYHGTTKRRKELRQGWNDKHHFNVCITSYTLASRDAHIFKRKAWYYMILDEAHMIKNFKSQRWNILLMFRSFRRLLLTGTPLQNNLTELWALLQFLMSGANFANLKEFGEWFSNPLEKAIEMGNLLDDETMQRVSKLHTVLRPYLLRRLKRDVEKELPSKYEHLVLCPLSKRQRFLYDEFMSRAHTRDALQSGVYQKIANILMQLRKVCNHPDLFEVRPIVTSFAMDRSAIADFEIKELLIRRHLFMSDTEELQVDLDVLGLRFINKQGTSSLMTAIESRRLDATSRLPYISESPGPAPPMDTRTISGYKKYRAHQLRSETIAHWTHVAYLNQLRCDESPIYGQETIGLARRFYQALLPSSAPDSQIWLRYLDSPTLISSSIKSYAVRAEEMASVIDKFAFVTPAVVARDMPRIALAGWEPSPSECQGFDDVIHRASVKLQIAFPDPSLLQYDCGKLQELTRLLREKKAGGHRVLIFTQMTRILDILEIFLNFHGYLYLRLDGATKIEDRQYITERFNADNRVFCFIASSRSGGVGINLTGADTVVFYDSDFNPQMDRQCEDRAHRIGQIRDVHIYRFVSQHTVEEAMLRKANQKRSLDDLVIQKGEFDWRSLFGSGEEIGDVMGSRIVEDEELRKALGEFEDQEDAHAAAVAMREEVVMVGQDEADFEGEVGEAGDRSQGTDKGDNDATEENQGGDRLTEHLAENLQGDEGENDEEDQEVGSVVDYMLAYVRREHEFFREWRI